MYQYQYQYQVIIILVILHLAASVVRRKKNLKEIGVEGKCELEEKGGEGRESEMEGRVG